MDMKDRMKIPRQPMPEQEAKVRARNFDEVPLGYTPETAKTEALRCIQCKNPACVQGCPVQVDIPGFITLVSEGDFIGAAKKIKETNALPAVCGRVCPQEAQCEQLCVRGKKAEPVAIGRLERFVADFERAAGEVSIPKIPASRGKKVAVVGSGPSGLTVAGDLIQLGYEVTIFEALHKPGGVLVYGIPEFRLPKAIVAAEVDYLSKMGVKIETSNVIGKIATVDELFEEGYDAVYLGTGAGLPTFMNIPGENLNGVYSANEYLTRSNLMKAYKFPEYDTPIVKGKNVAVIGGGNVAMDSARTAMRLGADHVYLVYRRSRAEMPARIEEIHHAEEEGIEFHLLTNPIRYIGNDKGWVVGMECLRMELGEPDDSGRRRPVPIKGSEYVIDIDTAVVAIGAGANPLVQSTTPGLDTNKWNYIIADEATGQTSREGVFAGGDIVTGAATVILAMGAGRNAATAIHQYLMTKK
ncbi:MAG TPA: NADPH-dependent glutamate synthase [Deltaproteobacteria bacterium]|nr:NADPH-dependent glutamate synthase [Deltaproteobacteria bacterium]